MKSKGFFKVKIWTYAVVTDLRTGEEKVYKFENYDAYKTFAKEKDAKKYANGLKHGCIWEEWQDETVDENGEYYYQYVEKRIDRTEIEEIW